MFDISFSELMVIGAVALVVLGPERLPRVARTIGLLLGRAQRYVNTVKADLAREMEASDLKNLKDLKQQALAAADEVKNTIAASAQIDDLKQLRQQTLDTARAAADSVGETAREATQTVRDAAKASTPPATAAPQQGAFCLEGGPATEDAAKTTLPTP